MKVRVHECNFPLKKLVTIKCQKAKEKEKIVNLVCYIFEPVGHEYNLEPTDILQNSWILYPRDVNIF